MDSIIFVFKFIFSVIGAILGFIWDVIVWCFDALAWLIRNIGDLYHWVIRSISDVYHWFMELDMLYQILIGVALVVLFGCCRKKSSPESIAKGRRGASGSYRTKMPSMWRA